MAEVTQAANGLPLLSSKKLPSFSTTNGSSSSSSKHLYEDVFASPMPNKLKSSELSMFSDGDYAEIFGSSKSDNSGWESSYGSIPVVELPVSEQGSRGSRVGGGVDDYSGVFGGVGVEELELPVCGEELIDQLKKKAKTSAPPIPRSKDQKPEVKRPHIASHSQNGEAPVNRFRKSFDSVQHLENKNSKVTFAELSEATEKAHAHSIPRSTFSLREVGPLHDTQPSKTPAVKLDTEISTNVNLEKKEKHSRNSSSELAASKQKMEDDAGFRKASVYPESISVAKNDTDVEADIKNDDVRLVGPSDLGANKQNSGKDAALQKAFGLTGSDLVDTSQSSCVVGPSKEVRDDAEAEFDIKDDTTTMGLSNVSANLQKREKDSAFPMPFGLNGSNPLSSSLEADVACGFDVGKKQRRHTRMTSLDFGDGGFQRKPRKLGGSYSFDASHDQFSGIRVRPSKVVPSSSLPQFFPVESRYKVSENGIDISLPSLDEQLDANSVAAVSAAALERAIEEAEMRIRLAKEFLEREGQGSTKKLRFKDTLKTKVVKENNSKRLSEVHGFEQKKMQEDRPWKGQKRESVLGSAQVVPVFEDQKKLPEVEEPDLPVQPKVLENGEEPKSAEEDEKQEGGGEWEAAKHLNLLISGVRSRLASFMAWQADTEKKEEPKEMEVSRTFGQQSEEGEGHLRKTENDQCQIESTSETQHEEDKLGSIPEISEEGDNRSMGIDSVERDIADDKVCVNVTSDVEGANKTNFLFFSFTGQKSPVRPCSEEEEKKEAQGVGGLEIEERQEVVNEVKDEQMQGEDPEANGEGFDDTFVSQGCGNSTGTGSSDEEFDENVEEPCSVGSHVSGESTNEENRHRRMDDDFGDERSESLTHEEGYAGSEDEECEDDKSRGIQGEEKEQRVNDEHGDDISETTDPEDNDTSVHELHGNDVVENSHSPKDVTEKTEEDEEWEELEASDEAEDLQDSAQVLEEANPVIETKEEAEVTENKADNGLISHIEEDSDQTIWEENKSDQSQSNPAEQTAKEVAEQAGSVADDDECRQTENVKLSKDEENFGTDGSHPGVEEAVFPDEGGEITLEIGDVDSFSDAEMGIECTEFTDEESAMMTDITNPSSELNMDVENPVFAQRESEPVGEEGKLTSVSAGNSMDIDGIESLDGPNGAIPCEDFVLHESETNAKSEQKGTDEEASESKSEDILENQTQDLNETEKAENVVEELASVSDQKGENDSVESVHRRRRWFVSGEKVVAAELPSILQKTATNLDTDQEVLEESDLAGSVEIHDDKLDSEKTEVTTATEADTASTSEDSHVNIGANKRRRWFVKRGEEGVPERPSLFEGIKVTLGLDDEMVNESESLQSNTSNDCIDKLNSNSGDALNVATDDVAASMEKEKQNVEAAAPRRKRWFESGEKAGPGQPLRSSEDEQKAKGDNGEMDDGHGKVEPVSELQRDSDAERRRRKERQKERLAVERAIREARERAFVEARERARRDAAEKPNAGSGAQEKLRKVSGEASSSSDKASIEAKLRAERAAVERATSEARERALQRALSEKASNKSGELDPKYQNPSSYSRCVDPSNKFDEDEYESAQRRKARLERQNRTMERAANALEEKNKRDLLAQKEQAARNMMADALDNEVKRWSCGKEGNLRALLSTLQYILGSDSGWQAISLTDLVAPTAVRKAYKKATLCVHPDKLQQRGATIQQKYICEKVFDLLKEAWGKFNPDER